MKFVIIGDRTLVLGFALAGVTEGYVAGDRKTVREIFSHCVEQTDIGIILIGAKAAKMIPDEIHAAKRSSRLIPVITIVPNGRDEKSPVHLQNQRNETVQKDLIR